MQILPIIESAPWPVVTQALYFSGRALLHAPHTTSYEDSLVYDSKRAIPPPMASHSPSICCEASVRRNLCPPSET